MRREVQHFIQGQWIGKPNAVSLNPATLEPVVYFPMGLDVELNLALSAAQKAFGLWQTIGVAERQQYFSKIHTALKNRARDLAQFIAMSTGKPMELALRLEIPWAQAAVQRWEAILSKPYEEVRFADTNTIRTLDSYPQGVVGFSVSPQFPLLEAMQTVIQSLALGNTVIIFAPDFAAATMAQLAEIFQQAEIPPGAVNVIFVQDQKIGANNEFTFLNPKINKSGFTFVAKDTDLNSVYEQIVRSCLLHQGQTPVSCQNIFVESEILETFTRDFIEILNALSIGDPLDRRSFLGPLLHSSQLSALNLLAQNLKHQGRKILLAPARPQLANTELVAGYFTTPLLSACEMQTCGSAVSQFLSPGLPAIQIIPVPSLLTAVRSIQHVSASAVTFWGANTTQLQTLTQQVKAENIWINNWLLSEPSQINGGGDILGPLTDQEALTQLQFPKSITQRCQALNTDAQQ